MLSNQLEALNSDQVGPCGGHETLSNQLEALNLGQVCHAAGKRVKDNSVVLSCHNSLVLLAQHEVYAWVAHTHTHAHLNLSMLSTVVQ